MAPRATTWPTRWPRSARRWRSGSRRTPCAAVSKRARTRRRSIPGARRWGRWGAVRAAVVWADDGDLLLLTTHEERGEVIALLERLKGAGWQPGNSLVEAYG